MANFAPVFVLNAAAYLPNGIPVAASSVSAPAPQTEAYSRDGSNRSLWAVGTSSLTGASGFSTQVNKRIPALVSYLVVDAAQLKTLRDSSNSADNALAAKADRQWQVYIVGGTGAQLYLDFANNDRGGAAIEGELISGSTRFAKLALWGMPIPHSLNMLTGSISLPLTPANNNIDIGSAANPFASIAAVSVDFPTGKGSLRGSADNTHYQLPAGGSTDPDNPTVLGLPVVDEGLPAILGLDGYPAVANYPLRGGAHGHAANIIHYSATGDAFTLAFCSHAAAAALFGANFPTAAAIDAAGGRMAPADNTLRITGHDESNQSINVTGAVVSAAGAAASSAIMVGGGLAASLALGSDDQTGVGFYRALRSATFALAAGAPLVVAGNVAAEAGLFASLRLRGREQPGASVVSAAPGANDDIDAGYVVGSRAIKTDGTAEWLCTANTAGAAVWAQVRGQAAIEVIWESSTFVSSGTHNLNTGKKFSDYSAIIATHSYGTNNNVSTKNRQLTGIIPLAADGSFDKWVTNLGVFADSQRNYVLAMSRASDTSFTAELFDSAHYSYRGFYRLHGMV